MKHKVLFSILLLNVLFLFKASANDITTILEKKYYFHSKAGSIEKQIKAFSKLTKVDFDYQDIETYLAIQTKNYFYKNSRAKYILNRICHEGHLSYKINGTTISLFPSLKKVSPLQVASP